MRGRTGYRHAHRAAARRGAALPFRRALGDACLLLALLLACTPAVAAVRLNEVMASNGATIADEDGDFEDWLELVNTGSGPAVLAGYGLSDRDQQPFRWVLPDVVLEPGGYLVIWASGKDRTDPNLPLHTNFSIAAGGEPVLLTAPDGTLVDRLDPTPIPRDASLGRQPDGHGPWLFFEVPTPGGPNAGEGTLGVLEPPVFSHEGGFYTHPFPLTLSTPMPGATILYSLDGSEPHPDHIGGTAYAFKDDYPRLEGEPFGPLLTDWFASAVYSGPLPIANRTGQPERHTQRTTAIHSSTQYKPITPVFQGTVVRARAVLDGYLPSAVATHTYLVTPEGAGRYDLPVIALAIPPDHLFDFEDGIYTPGIVFDFWRAANPEAVASVQSLGNYYRRGPETERSVHMELMTPGAGRVFHQNLGLRLHGGASRAYAFKSLRLYARNDYDSSNAMDFAFFPGLLARGSGEPLESFRRIILRNSGQDFNQTRMRDAFVQTLAAPIGLDSQAYQPAVHFINGEYWGIINIRERIDEHYFAAHYGVDPEAVAIVDGHSELSSGGPGDVDDMLALREYARVHDLREPHHYAYMAERMDIENFIRYNIVQIYTRNLDWPANNRSAWRVRTAKPPGGPLAPDDGRWRWILFDLDAAFGPWTVGGHIHPTLPYAMAPDSSNPLNPPWATVKLRRLMENPAFRLRFITLMADHINSTFHTSRVDELVGQLHGRIAPYHAEHNARWRGGRNSDPEFLRVFGRFRPHYMRQHMDDYFRLGSIVTITIQTDPDRGEVRINSLRINPDLPGVNPEGPYPWTGVYFRSVPIELEAIPAPGYSFARWSAPGAADPLVTFAPTRNTTLQALFLPNERIAGDINGDGKVNAIDVQIVINGALALDVAPYDPDVTGDGSANAVDVQLVINAVLGVS